MKMPETIEPGMFAPCGMNCKVCYKHCSHNKPCGGCLSSGLGKPGHCRSCKIKDCMREKGCAYCYECGDYPCKRIKGLEKAIKRVTTQALSKTAGLSGSKGLRHLCSCRKKNIPARNAEGLFRFMIRSAANADGRSKVDQKFLKSFLSKPLLRLFLLFMGETKEKQRKNNEGILCGKSYVTWQ